MVSEADTYMKAAIEEAQKSHLLGEVPIGAVVVKNGIIIGRGHNTREGDGLSTSHAEINAIQSACRLLGDWRLTDCDIYVTIEPCPMCCGAIYQSRIRTIYFGAEDPKAGACGSLFNLFEVQGLNHYCQIQGGIARETCMALMKSFFKKKR
jgi:tRNA(adenine34) deaminase